MTQSFRNKTVSLLTLLPEGHPAYLEDLEFANCVIQGPMVLLLVEDVAIRDNNLSGASLWPIEAGRPYEGGVGLRRVTFDDCTFVDVGIAATPEQIALFATTARKPAPTED